MSVTTEFRNSERISRNTWMYAGHVTITTDTNGEAEYDFGDHVGSVMKVMLGLGQSDTDRYVCEYDDAEGEITAYAVADDSTADDGTEIEIPFFVIGSKGRTTD